MSPQLSQSRVWGHAGRLDSEWVPDGYSITYINGYERTLGRGAVLVRRGE